ncbi:hypothetical protein Avbf_15089 [Armadillidium vulgare]|nr:hypothetical protein Avbf_15089 [Armadillidium vulgare]
MKKTTKNRNKEFSHYAHSLYFAFLITTKTLSSECSRRNYGYSSFVCVCDDTFCNFDGVSNSTIDTSNVRVIKSSRDEFRNSGGNSSSPGWNL